MRGLWGRNQSITLHLHALPPAVQGYFAAVLGHRAAVTRVRACLMCVMVQWMVTAPHWLAGTTCSAAATARKPPAPLPEPRFSFHRCPHHRGLLRPSRHVAAHGLPSSVCVLLSGRREGGHWRRRRRCASLPPRRCAGHCALRAVVFSGVHGALCAAPRRLRRAVAQTCIVGCGGGGTAHWGPASR